MTLVCDVASYPRLDLLHEQGGRTERYRSGPPR